MKHYVTFGQVHTHRVQGKTLDCDTVAVYEAERAEQSRRIGAKLVMLKGKRIFLDELKSTDKGGKIKSWDCGIFCDM